MGRMWKMGKGRKVYRGIKIVCNGEGQSLYLKA